MVYDAERDRVVLFGGWAGGSTNETWAYDTNTRIWVKMNPARAPSPRDAHAMAYDRQSKRIILFGGAGATDVSNQTWAYNLGANMWTERQPSISPPARLGARMVYDTNADRIILFGGHNLNGQFLPGTWAYDFDSDAWMETMPVAGPSPRAWQAMAYDAESRRIVLFGGDQGPGLSLADTWTYDWVSNSWVEMSPTGGPSRRAHAAAAYDSRADRFVLFGGDSGANETWVYDLNTNAWGKRDVTSTPSGRIAHAMAYDEESDRIVLFGGSWPPGLVFDPSITHNAETWAYDFNTNAWTLLIEPSGQGISALTVGLLVAAGIVGVGVAAAILWRRRKKA